MSIDHSGRRELYWTPAQFAALRDDEAFWYLLALCRAVNAIKAAQVQAIGSRDSTSPGASRQRIAGFFNLAATLFEALEFSKRLGKHFKSLASFSGVAALHRNKQILTLTSEILEPIRNTVVFHFDLDVMPRSRLTLAPDNFTFARWDYDDVESGIYYDLADLAALHTVLGSPASPEQFFDRIEVFLSGVISAARQFSKAAEDLIQEYVTGVGIEERAESGDP